VKHVNLVTLLTYLLSPWSRVLLEKLTGSQLVKKSPTFYGTHRFITVFTRAWTLIIKRNSHGWYWPFWNFINW